MKQIVILSLLLCSLMFPKHSVAGNIVDTEWEYSFLTITYSPTDKLVTCTVYNSSGDAIGGGQALPSGGVARVVLQVPLKYAGKPLPIKCSLPNENPLRDLLKQLKKEP